MLQNHTGKVKLHSLSVYLSSFPTSRNSFIGKKSKRFCRTNVANPRFDCDCIKDTTLPKVMMIFSITITIDVQSMKCVQTCLIGCIILVSQAEGSCVDDDPTWRGRAWIQRRPEQANGDGNSLEPGALAVPSREEFQDGRGNYRRKNNILLVVFFLVNHLDRMTPRSPYSTGLHGTSGMQWSDFPLLCALEIRVDDCE